MAGPLVSVVIPTFHRPTLVGRAVRSVLAQTVADLEAIVVVDSRDDETVSALGTIRDARLVVHVPDRHLGNADARNAGVALAHAMEDAFEGARTGSRSSTTTTTGFRTSSSGSCRSLSPHRPMRTRW